MVTTSAQTKTNNEEYEKEISEVNQKFSEKISLLENQIASSGGNSKFSIFLLCFLRSKQIAFKNA